MHNVITIILLLCIAQFQPAHGQFYLGADLSYVNELEDCGAVYKVDDVERDPYEIFSAHGTNLVRLRLWHTPSWYDNLNDGFRYGDFADVRQSIIRAKAAGMYVLLDFHLSDNWADPSHQVVPAAWAGVVDNLPALQDSLYNYIYSTLYNLASEGLAPAIVQIGNETNKGILQSQEQNDSGWALHWPKNSALFNAAIDAIRDVDEVTGGPTQIALHIANPADIFWMLDQFWDHGVHDFDIIGISYYADYHTVSIAYTGRIIASLRESYPGKDVMILETAYPWTLQGEDSANNLLNGIQEYTPSPANQKQWMIDLTQTVIDSGGLGVVYWEPAWISTSCSTQWAQGSHWENATFFDFSSNLMEDGGIGWLTHPYQLTSSVEPTSPTADVFEIWSDGKDVFIKQLEEILTPGEIQIDVLGTDGKSAFTTSILLPGKNGVVNVATAFAPGLYIVKLSTQGKVLHQAITALFEK